MKFRSTLNSNRTRVPLLATLALLAALLFVVFGRANPAYPVANAATSAVRTKPLPTKVASYLGVHESNFPASYSQTTSFKKTVGRWPNVAMYYSGWPERFQTAFAKKARSHGAVTLVDIDPSNVSLTSISSGKQNGYIDELAQQVRAYGHPVMISFGHEMNGTWYKWGAGHTTPAKFIAAWRKLVKDFHAEGAYNVTWVWTVSAFGNGSHPVAKWFPGKNYVNWVAIDGYIYRKSNDFSNTFGKTLKEIRKVTKKPIFISETGVGQVAGQAKKIPGLIEGVKKNKLLGLLWFDKDQNAGVLHQKWRIDGNKKAAAAFKKSLKKYYNKLSSTKN